MSIKSKVLATAATLALVGGVGTAGVLGTAVTANAATPSCGGDCPDLFSPLFGSYGHHETGFVLDVWRAHARIGEPIILYRSSQYDQAEDFQAEYNGLVSDFVSANLVSTNVGLHYGGGATDPITGGKYADDPAFEIEYAPYGVDSGLCVGLASTASQEEQVTLQNCGVSARTVWIADVGFDPGNSGSSTVTEYTFCPGTETTGEDCHTFTVTKNIPGYDPSFFNDGTDDPGALGFGYFPLINGSDLNFSHPYVLTYPNNGYPTDMPRPGLEVTQLTGFSNGYGPIVGNVAENQLWGVVAGVLY